MNPTAPARSPQVQADNDELDRGANCRARARAVSHNPVVSLADFVAVPVLARRASWSSNRTNRNDFKGIGQFRLV